MVKGGSSRQKMLDVNYVCVLNCVYVHAGVRGGQRCWTLLGLGLQAFCELPHIGAVCALHHCTISPDPVDCCEFRTGFVTQCAANARARGTSKGKKRKFCKRTPSLELKTASCLSLHWLKHMIYLDLAPVLVVTEL